MATWTVTVMLCRLVKIYVTVYFVLQKLSLFYAICIFFFQKSPYPESFSSHSTCDKRQMEVQHITINACTLYNRL